MPKSVNLATKYLGLSLQNPFVVGASPFCDDVYLARKLQDAGAGAVVMRSLFKEQIERSGERLARPPLMTAEGAKAAPEFSEFADYQLTPEQYVRQVADLKKTLTIPVIASLNGRRSGSWIDFAPQLERAGADAIEVNFYHVVTDPNIAADQVEADMLETVSALAGSVRIPVAVKLSPFHASIAQLAVALELAGASGVVVFNRFYQPDVNAEDIEVQPLLRLSEPGELLLRLRWLAILSPLLRGSLVATGGIHSSTDAVKAMLTGAHAVQLVSVLLRYGPAVLATLRQGVETWMREHGYAELGQFRGLLNLQRCRDPAGFERANYIRVLQSWKV
ncbi:MAG: dihydroorotate dehydrogenase-like protein [Opitutaceae bacterium]|nr:dihydroorotate dehydrogenase-like protein [Opitutaceae bacterium]